MCARLRLSDLCDSMWPPCDPLGPQNRRLVSPSAPLMPRTGGDKTHTSPCLPRASPRKSKEVWGRRWRQSRALPGLLLRRCAQTDCSSGLRARGAGFGVLWATWGGSSAPALWGQPLAPVPAPTDSAHRGGIFEMSNSSNGCVFVHLFPEIPFSPGLNRGVRPGLPVGVSLVE